MPFSGEDGFNIDDLLTPMESYLLQCTIPTGALLWPGLVTNNEDFPGYMSNHFPMPLPVPLKMRRSSFSKASRRSLLLPLPILKLPHLLLPLTTSFLKHLPSKDSHVFGAPHCKFSESLSLAMQPPTHSVMIYFFSLSKCLLSYLILSLALILSYL